MSATDKINLSGLTYTDIGRMAGVSRQTVKLFMLGQSENPKLAGWCLANAYKKEQIAFARDQAKVKKIDREEDAEKYSLPTPSNFVEMNNKTIETHPQIDLALLPDSLHGFVGYVS